MCGRQRPARNSLISRTNYWDVDHFCTMIPATGRTGCLRERPRSISTERASATSWFRSSQVDKINQKKVCRLEAGNIREKHHGNFTSWICNGDCGNWPLE